MRERLMTGDGALGALRRLGQQKVMLLGALLCLAALAMALGADLMTTRSPVRTRITCRAG